MLFASLQSLDKMNNYADVKIRQRTDAETSAPSNSGFRFSMTTAPIASVFPQRMTGCGEGIVATVRRLRATLEVRSVGLGRKTLNMLCKSAMLAVEWKWVPDTKCELTRCTR